MPENNSSRKKIMEVVVGIILPVFTFGMLWFWQTGAIGSSNGTDETAQTNIRSTKVRDALHAVERIDPLSDAVFHSADFNSLVDFTPQILPVPLGRPDPFSRPNGMNIAPLDPAKSRF